MSTISTEDYIKAIYKLEVRGEKATTSALASQLGVADASITDMIKKLSDKGLLHYERYQGVELTQQGVKMALGILRRHRLWEMFLVEFLAYSWDKVHDEAERLEHVTSAELEHAIDTALGHPTGDPHGDEIPTVDGKLPNRSCTALAAHEAGDVVRVLRVSDEDSAILQHAASLGVALNSRITVKQKMPFDGSLTIKIGKKEHFVSRQVADSIFVERV